MRAKDAVEQVLMPQCEQDYRAFHRTGRRLTQVDNQQQLIDEKIVVRELNDQHQLPGWLRLLTSEVPDRRGCAHREKQHSVQEKSSEGKKWGPGEQNRFRREKFIVSRLLSRLSEAGRRCSVAGTEPTSRCLQKHRRRLNLKWAILAKIEFWEWKVA